MIQRKRILKQSGILLKQNPGEGHLALGELRKMAANNNATFFMSKVPRYVANFAGTDSYWNKVKEELKAIITNVGAPTIFFTFFSADMHWPQLHALLNTYSDCTKINLSSAQERRQNVKDNLHLADCFFSSAARKLCKTLALRHSWR